MSSEAEPRVSVQGTRKRRGVHTFKTTHYGLSVADPSPS
ncbi:hypothetical protein SXCC_00402 [Gluconacetobacter sp. SXCC-1]|nr:hypothetical protein SXCC_00402 [Gluconacetobacter sp. SXCC-1]